jgi:precorrin-6A/cobalt-precorrin-6A reductase
MKLLLLGGTAEARTLADHLHNRREIALTVSLAGATRDPVAGPWPVRVGGFGGDEGFETYLADALPDAILDATHPFADRISHRTARIAGQHGIPYVLLLRPGWDPQQGDRWTEFADEAEAAACVTPQDRVFLATGRQTLERFSGLQAAYTWCRQIDPPEDAYPFENGEFLVGRPPFSVEDEIALFRRLGITKLVVKNAGGVASRSKLEAARHLGLEVLMLRRPDYAGLPQVDTAQSAIDWVEGLCHAHHSL